MNGFFVGSTELGFRYILSGVKSNHEDDERNKSDERHERDERREKD